MDLFNKLKDFGAVRDLAANLIDQNAPEAVRDQMKDLLGVDQPPAEATEPVVDGGEAIDPASAIAPDAGGEGEAGFDLGGMLTGLLGGEGSPFDQVKDALEQAQQGNFEGLGQLASIVQNNPDMLKGLLENEALQGLLQNEAVQGAFGGVLKQFGGGDPPTASS